MRGYDVPGVQACALPVFVESCGGGADEDVAIVQEFRRRLVGQDAADRDGAIVARRPGIGNQDRLGAHQRAVWGMRGDLGRGKPLADPPRDFHEVEHLLAAGVLEEGGASDDAVAIELEVDLAQACGALDRQSTRLNSSHGVIAYAVFCLE